MPRLHIYITLAIGLLVLFAFDFLLLTNIVDQIQFDRYQGPAHYANGNLK
jgi:hypothetical protein